MFNIDNFFKKRHALIIIFSLFTVILLCSCSTKKDSAPVAKQGKLDLSSWDFEKDGLAKLNGQWEIYPEKLLEPKDFNGNTLNQVVDYFKVPNSFIATDSNKKLPKSGYATMRLLINMNPRDNGYYGIKTRYLLSASKIWINGQLVSSVGKVGIAAASASGSYEHQMVFFNSHNSQIEIVIEMSNYNNVTGKVQDMFLENSMQIKRSYIINAATDIFTIGCLFIIGIYHFALYFKRKQYKEPLYFGIFSLIIALRTFLVSQRVAYEFIPNLPFSLFNKIAYLTAYTALPFILMYFKEIFKKEMSDKVVTGINIASLVISLITVFTDIEFYGKLLICFEIWTVGACIYVLYAAIKAAADKNRDSIIVLLGFIIFITSVAHDMLVQAGILFETSLAPYGFLIFTYSQAYLLASRFSDAFIKVEKLLEENKAMYIDELTGTLNRKGFYERGSNLYNAAVITGGNFTVFYGDLNRLKTINDNFGHKEGDEAIKATAKLLKKSFGKDDIVAHISGDEFIVIAVNKASEDQVKNIIELINNNFNQYNLTSNRPYKLSISIGYSIYEPSIDATFEELIHKADLMLYESKNKYAQDILL
jgi:diguanylate cyclase (GGDEF)-like protein